MKLVLVFVGFVLLGLNTPAESRTELHLISYIIQKEKFTISIERLDLGFFHNAQHFHFRHNEESLLVTHEHMNSNFQDSTLIKSKLKPSIIDSLISFCTSVKSFEIENPRKHNRLFNKSGVHDIIYVHNRADTVIISDVHSLAMANLKMMILRNKE